MDFINNNNIIIIHTKNPTNMNSAKKSPIKNVDNNISYILSDDENDDFNKKMENDYLAKERYLSNINRVQSPKVKNKNLNIYHSPISRNYNYNYNSNKNIKYKNNKSLENNINFNRGIFEKINFINRPSYYQFLNDIKLPNYSNFFTNNKRAFSGEKNYRPNHLINMPNQKSYKIINKLNNLNNNILQSNYASTNPNTKVTKIKKVPQDEINNNNNDYNILKNNEFYSMRNNNYQKNKNYNPNNNLNQTTPNLNIYWNHITKVKKISNKKPDDILINNNYNNNLSSKYSGNLYNLLNNNYINEIKKDFELPGANKTIGYLPLKKPLSSNNIDAESYQRLNIEYLQKESQDNSSIPIHYSNNIIPYINNESKIQGTINNREINNNKFQNISKSMNYGTNTETFIYANSQPLIYETALNQNDINKNKNNNGRITIVKKLSPSKKKVISNNNNMKPISPQMGNKNEISDPGKNRFSNNIKVKKIVNTETPKENKIKNILPNNQINMIPNKVLNQEINSSQNPKIVEIANHIINNKNININNNLQNKSINTFLIKKDEVQKSLKKNININKLTNPQYKNSPENKNIFVPQRQSQIIIDNIGPIPNQKLSPKRIILPSMESIRDTVSNIQATKEEEKNENKEEKQNENINKIPKNISYNDFDGTGWIKNYGAVSRPGKDGTGAQKINQDEFVYLTNINNIKDFNIFGVLDGHGPHGHFISAFASEFIPSQIIENQEIKSLSDPEKIYEKLKDNNCQIITKAFIECDEQMKKENFNAYESGTTCILVIHIGSHIICANVGDSRAIVAYDDQKNDSELKNLEVAQLSIDYKPNIPEERNRILKAGGEIEQMKDLFGKEIGPYRVWMKGRDYPGLAMSRSIGDLKAKDIGVIPDPGIMEYDLCESSKYIVIASDGVFEFLNNEAVKNIGKKYYLDNNASELCHQVINYSVFQWKQNEDVIDDITIVAVFFDNSN